MIYLTLLLVLILSTLLVFLQIAFAKKGAWISLVLPSIFCVISIYLSIMSPYWVAPIKLLRPIVFVLANIPTIILMAIHYVFKESTVNKKNCD
ncbi:hypothetical protein JYU01_01125 [bacterium AH-315-L21]|nr:hypothetical protein [bacterium AH-315-L21]